MYPSWSRDQLDPDQLLARNHETIAKARETLRRSLELERDWQRTKRIMRGWGLTREELDEAVQTMGQEPITDQEWEHINNVDSNHGHTNPDCATGVQEEGPRGRAAADVTSDGLTAGGDRGDHRATQAGSTQGSQNSLAELLQPDDDDRLRKRPARSDRRGDDAHPVA